MVFGGDDLGKEQIEGRMIMIDENIIFILEELRELKSAKSAQELAKNGDLERYLNVCLERISERVTKSGIKFEGIRKILRVIHETI